MTTYTGYLGHKKKAELEEIADALRVSSEGTRADIEQAIKNKLTDDNRLRESSKYQGLTGLGDRRAASSDRNSKARRSSSSDGIEVVIPASPEKPSSRRKSTTSSSRNLTATLADTAKEVVDDAIQQVQEYLPDSLEDAGNQLVSMTRDQLAVARQVDTNQVIRTATQWVHTMEKQLGQTARAAQTTLSDSWTVVAVTILAELIFVLSASVPYTKEVTIGPIEWWSHPWTADSPYTLTLPDLLVLRQYGVLRPILVWMSTSILIPLLGAHLVVFPKPTHHRRGRSANHYLFGLAPPSALTYSILRLASSVYLNKLTASPLLSFSSDIVHRFGDIQILCSCIAVAFATYELLADRH